MISIYLYCIVHPTTVLLISVLITCSCARPIYVRDANPSCPSLFGGYKEGATELGHTKSEVSSPSNFDILSRIPPNATLD